MTVEYQFKTRQQASRAAAERITELLERRLAADKSAALVVSGGTTPAECFSCLADTPLDWPRVHVVMSDERWVAGDDDASNQKMIGEHLLTGQAAAAQLLPVFDACTSIAQRCEALNHEVAQLPSPFACCLLGMGEDGHFASLFPDAANLAEGLDLHNTSAWMPVATAASPLMRVSMTLAALLRSDEIIVLAFGETKQAVLAAAREATDQYPVSHLLAQEKTPVRIFWAP